MLEQTPLFILSAFGDEIDKDLDNQLKVLNELRIGYLELRSVWGANVLKLRNEEIERLKLTCENYDVQVSCIGSPVGKSPIQDPLDQTLADLTRILDIAEILDTNNSGIVETLELCNQEWEDGRLTSLDCHPIIIMVIIIG